MKTNYLYFISQLSSTCHLEVSLPFNKIWHFNNVNIKLEKSVRVLLFTDTLGCLLTKPTGKWEHVITGNGRTLDIVSTALPR